MNKSLRILCALGAIGLWATSLAPSQAATLTYNPGYAPGIGYEYGITMSGTDSITFGSADHPNTPHSNGVGAKSWAEPGQPVGLKGWTHTSQWVDLNLTEEAILSVTLSRGATGSLFPAFSIYSGRETVGPETHQFNNIGNTSWAANLTYLGHVANAGGPNGTDNGIGVDSVSGTFSLGPGLYSIVFGNNPAADFSISGRHPFVATLTTAPVPVPAAVYLFGSGLIGLAGLARRRMNA